MAEAEMAAVFGQPMRCRASTTNGAYCGPALIQRLLQRLLEGEHDGIHAVG
jgi:hypothetical protein